VAAVNALALAFWRGIFAPTPADFVANPQVDPVLERGAIWWKDSVTAGPATPRVA
jgi:hypothetical protein